MNKPTTSKPWWAALGFGSRESNPDTDYADMGTAFGLDASMHSLPTEEDESASGSGPKPPKPPGAGSAS